MKILLLILSPFVISPVAYIYGDLDEWAKITLVEDCKHEYCLYTADGLYAVSKDKPTGNDYWRDYCNAFECK